MTCAVLVAKCITTAGDVDNQTKKATKKEVPLKFEAKVQGLLVLPVTRRMQVDNVVIEGPSPPTWDNGICKA